MQILNHPTLWMKSSRSTEEINNIALPRGYSFVYL